MTKNKSKPFAMLMSGLLWLGLAQAQESTSASGGYATGSSGNIAYSIGQVAYTTNIGTNGSAAQGVQHAYEIYTVGMNETAPTISLTTFPNPTIDNLTLQISEYSNKTWSYTLLDMQGKQVRRGQLAAQQTQVNMRTLPKATYFIHVMNQENKIVESFKIIKN